MKYQLILALLAIFTVLPISTYAQTPTEAEGKMKKIKAELQEIKDQIKPEKNNQSTPEGKRMNALKSMVARITDGVVTATGSSSLTVSKDGISYTVNLTNSTKLRRHFWGKSTVSEIAANDKVNVIGKYTDDTKTTINALLVKDLSIQKRAGVFIGTVSSITGNTFVLKTVNRGDETVTMDSTTKLVNRMVKTMVVGDVKVNDKVRVKGLWDKTNNTITEVKEVKDFSVPVQDKTKESTESAK